MDVVCGEDGTVSTKERKGGFEATGDADAGDDYWFLEFVSTIHTDNQV